MAVTTHYKGEAILIDASKKGSAKMLFSCAGATVPTLESLGTLTDVLAVHTQCFIKDEKLLTTRHESELEFTGNKKVKALLVAQEPNGNVHRWEYPDPMSADVDGVATNVEDRFLKPATADILIAAIAVFTGMTLTSCPCPIFEY